MGKIKTKKKIALIKFSNISSKVNALERFQQEALALGYKTDVLNKSTFFISFKKGRIEIYHNEKKLKIEDYLAFIPVVSISEDLPENTFFLDALKQLGANIANDPEAIRLAKNKTKSLFKLATNGVPIIPSAINFSHYQLGQLFKSIKHDDFICKANKGSSGRGVAIIKSKISLISIFELMVARHINPSSLLFQKFIKGAKGKDYRIIISNNKVIASMERRAQGIEFRTNLSGTGVGTKINKLPNEIRKISIKAMKVIGLDYGGVDILISRKKPMVIEVNANPGLLIEEITNRNITKKILQNIIKKFEK